MARPKNTTPVYKLHKSTGLARCWLNGKWHTLGKYGSSESRAEFARIIAELDASPAAVVVSKQGEVSPTVDQILLAFREHAATRLPKRIAWETFPRGPIWASSPSPIRQKWKRGRRM